MTNIDELIDLYLKENCSEHESILKAWNTYIKVISGYLVKKESLDINEVCNTCTTFFIKIHSLALNTESTKERYQKHHESSNNIFGEYGKACLQLRAVSSGFSVNKNTSLDTYVNQILPKVIKTFENLFNDKPLSVDDSYSDLDF